MSIVSVFSRGGSGTPATSNKERFVIIVNRSKPLTIIAKRSILDIAAALDPPLVSEIGASNWVALNIKTPNIYFHISLPE